MIRTRDSLLDVDEDVFVDTVSKKSINDSEVILIDRQTERFERRLREFCPNPMCRLINSSDIFLLSLRIYSSCHNYILFNSGTGAQNLWLVVFFIFYFIIFYTASDSKYLLQNLNILFLTMARLIRTVKK